MQTFHDVSSNQYFYTGLCGGSASGKTTVARKIIEALDVPWVVLLSMDSFYKVCSMCAMCGWCVILLPPTHLFTNVVM